jgi:class 3 adenylate cyclase
MQPIEDWLAKIGLERYAAAFASNDIDVAVLPHLTDADLEKVGVSLGHRRKILAAIAELRGAIRASPQPLDSAERRQVTVMFSDLVGSTALSVRMDPEDLREVISAYQKCVAETVRRFDGFVAKYLGDGVLVYFGYPQAHEDDAERAVRAGLELIAAVGGLKTRVLLQSRVGIATGLVVVGDLIGSGDAQERGIVGETPNLAARLQGIAEPNTVVIADSTRRLLGNLFDIEDLGPRELKGIAEPVRAWAALRTSSVESRFEALHPAGLTALVGREEECELLLRRWSRAKSGEGQVVLLSGEPGIGKSRLTIALLEHLASEPHIRLRYFCSPHHQDSAFYPVIAQLERAAGLDRQDTPRTKLDKLAALLSPSSSNDSDLQLLAELLSLPTDDRFPALDLSPQRKKRRTLEALLCQLEMLSRERPVLMVHEDVHWVDPSSRELLDMSVERVARLPVLLVMTFRPDFQPPWTGQAHVSMLNLSRLGRREGAALVERVAGTNVLPDEMMAEIVERTDGVPLFVEELTKAVLEAGPHDEAITKSVATAPLPVLSVPATLHASLMARLDRLGPAAKEIAQAGAAIGREFSYEVLALVVEESNADLAAALGRLIDAGLVSCRGVPPQATFLFKHALVRDAAYGTLLRGRRQRLHASIAAVVERRFPEMAHSHAELLAHHYTEADKKELAITYWLRAGQQATGTFAMKEAIAHFTKGTSLLATLPEDRVRDEREIDFQLALAVPLIATYGYGSAEVEVCARRANELSDRLGDHAGRFAVCRLVWNSSLLRRPVPQSLILAHQLMTLARDHNDTARLAIAHRALGYSRHIAGAQADADVLLTTGVALADSVPDAAFAVYGEHPGMVCRSYRGVTRCLMGYLDDAVRLARAAIHHARTRNNPVSLAWALISAASTYVWLVGDASAAEHAATEAIALSREHGLTQWMAFARQSLGRSMCQRGDLRAGTELQAEAIQPLLAAGSLLHTTRFQLQLAESLLELGNLDQARSRLDLGFTHLTTHGETYAAADLHRVQVMLLQAEGAPDDLIHQVAMTGIDTARGHGARLLELRLTTCLARLWRDQGRRTEARDLLAPVYGWFTEGFDTVDLKQAKALLDELAS